MERPIYLDYAATTPVDLRVAAVLNQYLSRNGTFGNPSSSTHALGRVAANAIETARAHVAVLLNTDPRDLVWTSGATEANNLALFGVMRAYARKGRHLLTSQTEHKAVLDVCRRLEREGCAITYLVPDPDGLIPPERVAAALRPDTVLVSLMQVNNETGIIHDIAALGAMCRERNVRFHVDAAQSAGRLAIDVGTLAVDYLSLSAHKFYGPQGIGALFVRDRPRAGLVAQMHGGGQERERRAGTLAVHQIVGMGAAADIVMQERETEQARLTDLVARLETALADVPDLVWIGSDTPRVPSIRNVVIRGAARASLLASLWDTVSASAGSACSAAEGEPSAVLQSLGLDPVTAQGALRLSPGRWTREADIDRAAAALRRAIIRLQRVAAGEPVDQLPGPHTRPAAS